MDTATLNIRKPDNLITNYWDDLEHFLKEAEKENLIRNRYNKIYQIALDELPDSNKLRVQIPELPIFEKRNIKFAILSAFLFLEAFINGEYFEHQKYSIRDLNLTQKQSLEKELFKTPFNDKWSKWVSGFIGSENHDLKNDKEFKDLQHLKKLRDQLVHYKIHELMEVAHVTLTFDNAREAKRISKNMISWYYGKTKGSIPEWISRDIVGI